MIYPTSGIIALFVTSTVSQLAVSSISRFLGLD